MSIKQSRIGRNDKVVLTSEQIAQVEALAAVLSLEQIADYFGVGKVTFYAIMSRQPEVAVRYHKGKAKAIEGVASSLLKQTREGNTSAIIFYLKTQAGWRDQTKVDITSNGETIGSTNDAVMAAIKRFTKATADTEDSESGE